MKVFVSGATGVLGHRAVAQLVAAGHDVTGVARSAGKQAALTAAGATPAQISLFDRDAVMAAVAGHDVVCNLATAIPVGERAGAREAWEENRRIRIEGSRNLVDAALEAGASRFVQESVSLLYADGGDQLLDESAPVDATWITGSSLSAEAQAARFADHGGAGVILRFGTFYGPDSGHTLDAIEAARAGAPVQLGPAGAYWSPVTTDDAAAAVVAALDAPSGVYNVNDDRPVTRAEYVEALVRAFELDPPDRPTLDVELPPEQAMMTRSLRVSNAKFEAATGWRPRYPTAREGWAFIAASVATSNTTSPGR
jgi:nucleoside-diphosphate-sugar epimerase